MRSPSPASNPWENARLERTIVSDSSSFCGISFDSPIAWLESVSAWAKSVFPKGVHSVAFSPDGQILASDNGDGTIKLWNVSTGQEIRTLAGHSNTVRPVIFSPDGGTLASGSWDKTVKLWNVKTGQEIFTFMGYSSGVSSVAFSPDSMTLASGSWNNTIKLWNVSTGQ